MKHAEAFDSRKTALIVCGLTPMLDSRPISACLSLGNFLACGCAARSLGLCVCTELSTFNFQLLQCDPYSSKGQPIRRLKFFGALLRSVPLLGYDNLLLNRPNITLRYYLLSARRIIIIYPRNRAKFLVDVRRSSRIEYIASGGVCLIVRLRDG